MPVNWNNIRTIRGRKSLDEGLTHLRGVADGKFEGADDRLSFRGNAKRLLQIHESLTSRGRNVVTQWLGEDRSLDAGGALRRMEKTLKDSSNHNGWRKRESVG